MGRKGAFGAFLGLTRMCRLVFAALSMWKFFSQKSMGYFYTYVVVFGLMYIIELIIIGNNVCNLILTIFGMGWFRFPLLVEKPKFRQRMVCISVANLVDCVLGTYLSAYICIQTKLLPLWISIVHLLSSIVAIPLLYEGVLFQTQMRVGVLSYAVLIIEHFLTVAFASVFWTLKYFWVVFCVGCWRFIACCEPFAFWASLHTIVSPFRAMDCARSARSLFAIYVLYMELFFILYSTAWFMEYNTLNIVFCYLYVLYFCGFIIFELCECNTRSHHRIKPITQANDESPDFFDGIVL